MKLNGKTIKEANYEWIVIPRPEGSLVFKATALRDLSTFHALVPAPVPRMRMLPGGRLEPDPDDKGFLQQQVDYGKKRFSYHIIASLQETPGLEWDTVQLTDPNTWDNWQSELLDAGFSSAEINLIANGVLAANALNEEKLEAARQAFFHSLAAATSAA